MTKRSTLILQPLHSTSADILRRFAEGKPLDSSQLHYLDWYQKQLSSREFDPVLEYYVHSSKRRQYKTSFLMPTTELNNEAAKKLKRRLHLFLKQSSSRAVIGMSQNQFNKFKQLNVHELVFWHGNQSLTGSPVFPGGIPPVIYFQWGNFFGVVKYIILAGEKALKANLLVYFEDRQERNIDECVHDYENEMKRELTSQNEVLAEYKFEPEEFNKFLIRTPTLKRV